MPIARLNDWNGGSHVGVTSERVHKSDWTFIEKTNNNFSIFKHNNNLTYVIGEELATNEFMRYCLLKVEPSFQTGKKLNIEKLFAVKHVMTADDVRGTGFATIMYKWFVEKYGPLISDYEQYKGARALWSSLSNDPECIVNVVDLNVSRTIEYNVSLYCGFNDEYDSKYWSTDFAKEPLRFTLFLK